VCLAQDIRLATSVGRSLRVMPSVLTHATAPVDCRVPPDA